VISAELIGPHTERQQQFNGLHHQLASDYALLEQKYNMQRLELVEYKQQAHYWEALFKQLKSKQETLEDEHEELKAQLRQREQQLFGKRSEKSTAQDKVKTSFSNISKKPRGQQHGSQGHGRRDYDHLPMVEESLEILAQDAKCPCCQLAYDVLPGTEDSEVLEVINVQAYRRVVHRKMYKRTCQCPKNPDPQIVTAPVVERVLAKSKLGVSIWAHLLLNKYGYQQPLYRCLKQLNDYGLSLAMGTVTDGFQKLLPLFVPLYDAIVERSLMADHWHADETGWKVFEMTEEKKNSRWYLWVFRNTETAVYKMDGSRSSQVLLDHFGESPNGGTLNVDRYIAYKVIAKSGLFILAFCWAHVRRDFLSHSKSHPEQENWGLSWVEAINGLYHINNERIKHQPGSIHFQQQDKALKKALKKMQETAAKELTETNPGSQAKKILVSLNKHWQGLTVFVDRSEIPMDNNQAERSLRNSVVGRKNYYGSGSIWSAELAAVLFTILESIKLWKINLHTWLLAYLQECAMSGGAPPPTLKLFLPWEMTDRQRELFSRPPKFEHPQ